MTRANPAAAFVMLLIIVLALAAWRLSFVLLLAFLAVLIAVLLRHLALILSRHTPVSDSVGVMLAALGLAFLVGLGVLFLGPRIFGQVEGVIERLPSALAEVEAFLRQYSWGQFLLDRVPSGDHRPSWNILGTIGGTLSTVIGVLVNLVILFSMSIFLAIDPGLYRRGLLHLVPLDKRRRATEILDALAWGLWHWMLGQGLAMAAVALMAGVGLWLIGVPLALALGIIAGLMDIIPYVGPWLGAAPAVLLALGQGPSEAIYAAILFLVIQQIEGHVLVPIIQKKESSLPPVLTILGVVAFGVLFGFMGILLATPLLLVLLILVRMIYVEDVLGDRSAPGPEEKQG